MYKLFKKDKKLILLDYSNEESDVIDSLGSYIGYDEESHYQIYYQENDKIELKCNINSLDDYINYKYNSNYKVKRLRR